MKLANLALLIPLSVLPNLSFAAGGRTKEIDKTFPLKADGEVRIDTFKGSVTVTASASAEVKVHARIELDESCRDDPRREEKVKLTDVKFETTADRLTIESDYSQIDDWGGFRNLFEHCTARPFIHYQVSAPATAKINIRDHKSKIRISDIHSDIRIRTHKGQVEVSGLEGAMDLETHKGEARIAFSKLARSSRFDTYKGEIELVLPKGAGFKVDADIGRRGTLKSGLAGVATTGGSRRGETVAASVNGGGPALRLSTHKGRFEIKLAS